MDVDGNISHNLNVPCTVVPLIPSEIRGNPKLPCSEHYTVYKLGAKDQELHRHKVDDTVWMLVHQYYRNPSSAAQNFQQTSAKQDRELLPVPIWSAYNSVKCVGSKQDGVMNNNKLHTLPPDPLPSTSVNQYEMTLVPIWYG